MKPYAYSIGVIADTHNKFLPGINDVFRQVDEIWHLGDVCREEVLDELRALNGKLTVVLGNNDLHLHYPLTLDLERHGERFHLVHIPPRQYPTAQECDWLLFGHTHVVQDEIVQGVHLFNPGSAGRANKGELSVGLLHRPEGGKFHAEVVRL